MNIIIVDDHAIFRESLSYFLNSFEDIKVSATLGSIQELKLFLKAIDINTPQPTMVLLDYHMPGEESLASAIYFKKKFSTIKFVFLTASQSSMTLNIIAASPVDGVLHKEESSEQLVAEIYTIAKGLRVISNTILSKCQQSLIGFTKREYQVLNLLANGYSAARVSDELSISPRTVDKHKEHIMQKADVSNIVELLAWVNKQGFFNLEC